MDTLNLEQLKTEVHQSVLSKLDLEKLSLVEGSRARQAVAAVVQETLAGRNVPLTAMKRAGSNPTCWTRSSDWDRWSRCSRTRPSPTSW